MTTSLSLVINFLKHIENKGKNGVPKKWAEFCLLWLFLTNRVNILQEVIPKSGSDLGVTWVLVGFKLGKVGVHLGGAGPESGSDLGVAWE